MVTSHLIKTTYAHRQPHHSQPLASVQGAGISTTFDNSTYGSVLCGKAIASIKYSWNFGSSAVSIFSTLVSKNGNVRFNVGVENSKILRCLYNNYSREQKKHTNLKEMKMSKVLKLASLILLSIFVFGCAGMIPQSAEEYRTMVPGASMGRFETFTVDQKLTAVSETFRKMTNKCLNGTVTTTSTDQYGNERSMVTTYHPTLLISNSKLELHLQEEWDGIVLGVVPDKGHYLLVLDAIKVGNSKTEINLFHNAMGVDPIVRAVKNWAMNKNVGCPNLTRL